MKYILSLIILAGLSLAFTVNTLPPDAAKILEKVDENMSSESRIVESEMVIYGKRKNRTVASRSYSRGAYDSFTEYLAPDREKGTKMLKLKDRLWIFSPSTDRTIQLSGHMLRQSVMGSDLSYEDMMEDRELTDIYDAKVVGEATIDDRPTWQLELIAKVDDTAYYSRMVWVDQEKYVPLQEELYAKSGELLKKTSLSEVTKIDGRWFPKKMNYKDMLKSGKGTDFIIKDIQFDVDIEEFMFTKAALKK